MKYKYKFDSERYIELPAKFYIACRLNLSYNASPMSVLSSMQEYLRENEKETYIKLIDLETVWECVITDCYKYNHNLPVSAIYKHPWRAINECIAQWFYQREN